MHAVRPADRFLADFGQPEEAHLAFPHQLRHRADDVLNWHGRVETMLVEEVDVVGVQPAE